jgi:hypothetical protein
VVSIARSKKEAKALGLPRFFSSKPCRHGHIAERFTSGCCIECANARARAVYAANVDKAREKGRLKAQRRREADPERDRLRNRSWSQANREKLRMKRRAWVRANPEKERESARKHREANLEKRRAAVRAAYRANPKLWRAHAARRKALKRQRMPIWADQEKIRRIYENCPAGHHVDHIYPLRGKIVSGLHVEWNLQYLPAVENLRKRNRMPEAA